MAGHKRIFRLSIPIEMTIISAGSERAALPAGGRVRQTVSLSPSSRPAVWHLCSAVCLLSCQSPLPPYRFACIELYRRLTASELLSYLRSHFCRLIVLHSQVPGGGTPSHEGPYLACRTNASFYNVTWITHNKLGRYLIQTPISNSKMSMTRLFIICEETWQTEQKGGLS